MANFPVPSCTQCTLLTLVFISCASAIQFDLATGTSRVRVICDEAPLAFFSPVGVTLHCVLLSTTPAVLICDTASRHLTRTMPILDAGCSV